MVKKLFQEMKCTTPENLNIEVDDVTKSLINAYKNANNRNTKTQILSLYAHKCSFSTLKKTLLAIWKVIYAPNSPSKMPCKNPGSW